MAAALGPAVTVTAWETAHMPHCQPLQDLEAGFSGSIYGIQDSRTSSLVFGLIQILRHVFDSQTLGHL